MVSTRGSSEMIPAERHNPGPPGTIVTLAGTGQAGFSGDGGPATQACLHRPIGLAAGAAGEQFFADIANERVRRVSPGGIITTVAGNGEPGFSGDGGSAIAARMHPTFLALDQSGNLHISDYAVQRVRRVTAAGIISSVAGSS